MAIAIAVGTGVVLVGAGTAAVRRLMGSSSPLEPLNENRVLFNADAVQAMEKCKALIVKLQAQIGQIQSLIEQFGKGATAQEEPTAAHKRLTEAASSYRAVERAHSEIGKEGSGVLAGQARAIDICEGFVSFPACAETRFLLEDHGLAEGLNLLEAFNAAEGETREDVRYLKHGVTNINRLAKECKGALATLAAAVDRACYSYLSPSMFAMGKNAVSYVFSDSTPNISAFENHKGKGKAGAPPTAAAIERAPLPPETGNPLAVPLLASIELRELTPPGAAASVTLTPSDKAFAATVSAMSLGDVLKSVTSNPALKRITEAALPPTAASMGSATATAIAPIPSSGAAAASVQPAGKNVSPQLKGSPLVQVFVAFTGIGSEIERNLSKNPEFKWTIEMKTLMDQVRGNFEEVARLCQSRVKCYTARKAQFKAYKIGEQIKGLPEFEMAREGFYKWFNQWQKEYESKQKGFMQNMGEYMAALTLSAEDALIERGEARFESLAKAIEDKCSELKARPGTKSEMTSKEAEKYLLDNNTYCDKVDAFIEQHEKLINEAAGKYYRACLITFRSKADTRLKSLKTALAERRVSSNEVVEVITRAEAERLQRVAEKAQRDADVAKQKAREAEEALSKK
jgi:hypothetical protein